MILRNCAAGIETLLVKRNSHGSFADTWVFPGGVIEEQDWQGAKEEENAALRAAVRETLEETQLPLLAENLIGFAHWTTPVAMKKRYASWFFVCGYEHDTLVSVDQEEIVDFRWLSPQQALAEQKEGLLKISPPTYISLLKVCGPTQVSEALAAFDGQVKHFTPISCEQNGQRVVLYNDDCGYASVNPDAPGRRHRMIMSGTWQYIKD